MKISRFFGSYLPHDVQIEMFTRGEISMGRKDPYRIMTFGNPPEKKDIPVRHYRRLQESNPA